MIIALIDNIINLNYIIHTNNVKTYCIINNVITQRPNNWQEKNITHATICTSILESLIEDYQLINIEIINTDVSLCSVENLAKALTFCMEMQVDVISLSIGTTRLSDSIILYPIIKKMASKGIIVVAAHSNQGYMTLPAAYSEVIGVVANKTELFQNSDMYTIPHNQFGIDIISAYKQNFNLFPLEAYFGNSFVVPVVVACVCKIIKSGIKQNVDFIKLELQKCLQVSFTDINKYFNYYYSIDDYNVPNVLIMSKNNCISIQIINLLEYLAIVQNVEAVCITDRDIEDIRFVQFNKEKKTLKEDIKNNYYANIDLIFFWLQGKNIQIILKNLKIDCIIELEEDYSAFYIEGILKQEYRYQLETKKIGNLIVSALEE